MSIAANDAFSFALAHNGPRRRSSTRSPSPISSVGLFPKRQVIRRLSNLQPFPTEHTDDPQSHGRKKTYNPPQEPMTSARDPPPSHSSSLCRYWELPRKTLHSSIGFITIYLYVSDQSPKTIVLALCTALAIVVPADILRFRFPAFARTYERYLGFLMRDSEKDTWNGVIWYLLGVISSLLLYPVDVAVVSILILSWADTAASTIGRFFGSYTPRLPARLPILRLPLAPRKSWAGSLAATLTGACIAFVFWKHIGPLRPMELTWTWERGVNPIAYERPSWLPSFNGVQTGGWWGLFAIAVVAGLVTGIAEALDLSLDDNFTLPVISGGCLFGFFKLSEWLFS